VFVVLTISRKVISYQEHSSKTMDSYNGIIILKEPVEKKQSNPASKVAAYLLLASLFVVGAASQHHRLHCCWRSQQILFHAT
jgi:hypothetical protein